jgi:L-2,4-diaminobutyrate decarboxylase
MIGNVLGEYYQDQRIWFHVDGAQGASALFSPDYPHSMDGVSLASSLTWLRKR